MKWYFFKYHFNVSSSYSCMMVAIHRMFICSWVLLYHLIPLIPSCLFISGRSTILRLKIIMVDSSLFR